MSRTVMAGDLCVSQALRYRFAWAQDPSKIPSLPSVHTASVVCRRSAAVGERQHSGLNQTLVRAI